MYIFADLIFVRNFSKIEKTDTKQNMSRVLNALDKEVLNLSSINTDWAIWDDTYKFIQSSDTNYIGNNLVNETFMNLKLNFMIFMDNENKVVFSKGFNLDNNKSENIPYYIMDYLTSDPYIYKHSSVNSSTNGVMSISEKPLIISSMPITSSLREGPIRGTLIIGRYIDYKFINQLSKTTDFTISLSKIIPENTLSLNTKEDITVKPLDKTTISAYTIIKDLHNNPAFILEIQSPREIYNQAKISKLYFNVAIIITCLTFSIIALWILDKSVLSPTIDQEVLLNTIPALVYYKDGSLKYITGNSLFSKFFNIKKEHIRGKTDYDFFPKEDAEAIRNQDLNILSSGYPKLNMERKVTLLDGNTMWTSTSKAPYVGEDGKVNGMVGITMNITNYKTTENRIHYLKYYDPLTDLPNRTLFNTLAMEATIKSNIENSMLAILYMDLDKFKLVNDALGHNKGDILLKVVADRLSSCIRKDDLLARLGGDEFGILMNISNEKEIDVVCQKILDAMNEPWYIDEYSIKMNISIGAVLYPKDGQDVNTLLKCADIAMYRAKGHGKSCYEFYTPTLSNKVQEDLCLETSLLNALKNNEFELYYQPQFNIKNNEIVGAEALIRWNNPKLGIIPPSKFIPYAEENGLIIPIGEWVIKKACEDIKAWQEKGLKPILISINLSIKQFQQSNLVDIFSSILKANNLPPEYLQIEVTESMAMDNPEYTLETLYKLKSMGIKIALDDFGTGYSSLSYVTRFPLDKLKIDKSFINHMQSNLNDSEIVKIIILLARKINISVIAEGVETEEQLAFLKEEGCDEIQGYLLGKPMPLNLLEELLKG